MPKLWTVFRNAYSKLEQNVNMEPTWSSAVSLSLSTTPSAVMLRTWLIPKHEEGKVNVLFRAPRPVNMICFDFKQFSFKLFVSAQSCTCLDQFTSTGVWVDRWYNDVGLCVVGEFDQRVAYVHWLEVRRSDDKTGNCDWLSQRLQESFWQALSPHAFQHWRSGLVTKHGEQQDLSTGLQPTTSTPSYCAPPFSIGTRWSLPFSLRESRRLNHSVQVFSTSLSRHHLTEQNHNTPAVTGHAHSWALPVTAVRYSTEVPMKDWRRRRRRRWWWIIEWSYYYIIMSS